MQGSLVCGGVADDRLVINDISRWTGHANPMGQYRGGGEVQMDSTGRNSCPAYRRERDLAAALARIVYTVDPVIYTARIVPLHQPHRKS